MEEEQIDDAPKSPDETEGSSPKQAEPPVDITKELMGDAPPAAGGRARTRQLRDNPTQPLLALACLVVVIFGVRYAAGVINPILVALFVVMGISPVLDWMRRRKVPGWLAITLVLIFFLALAAALGGILASYATDLTESLNKYQVALTEMLNGIQTWFAGHGVDTSDFFASYVDVDRITSSVSTVLSSVVDAFSNVVLILLIVLFMVAQVYSFPRKAYSQLSLSKRFERSFKDFTDFTRSYLFTKGWLALLATLASTGIYYAFGVDFALLWGLVFFVLSFIPNFGFILSLIPPFTVTLLEAGFTRAFVVVLVIFVLNGIVDNVLAPRFMSKSVGLTTLSVFLSLLVWAWILGPVGALISVPLTLMVKLLVFDSYESTHVFSMFLTGGKEMVSSGEKKRRSKRRSGTPAE